MNIREFTVEKALISASNALNPLAKDSFCVSIGKSTLDKSLMSARNVINLSPKGTT